MPFDSGNLSDFYITHLRLIAVFQYILNTIPFKKLIHLFKLVFIYKEV